MRSVGVGLLVRTGKPTPLEANIFGIPPHALVPINFHDSERIHDMTASSLEPEIASGHVLRSATTTLGRFCAVQARTDLTPAVAHKAACCLLDSLGLAILARNEATVAAMCALATPAVQGATAARIWPDDARVALSDAVVANAVAVHAFFQDDCDGPSWSHPASLVIPVAVSAGESVGATLASVLRAIAIGYGSIAWLGAKERVARALIERGIRTSPTLGTVAAAAAATAIFQLDAIQAVHAVGIASSITGGVLEPVGCGSDEWRVQNGHAARGGLLAAQLARSGTTGAPAGLEGAKGLLRSLAGLHDVPEWQTEPTVESVLDVWAKPWATLGDNMPAIAAARALRDAGVQSEQVVAIKLIVWRHYAEYPGTSFRGPFETVPQAIASTAFGVSAMLARGELDYAVSQNCRHDPEIVRLAKLTCIDAHDGSAHDATAEVTLADGSTITRSAKDAPRTLFYHDRLVATALLEARLGASGWPKGAGVKIADMVFADTDDAQSLRIGDLLDALTQARVQGNET